MSGGVPRPGRIGRNIPIPNPHLAGLQRQLKALRAFGQFPFNSAALGHVAEDENRSNDISSLIANRRRTVLNGDLLPSRPDQDGVMAEPFNVSLAKHLDSRARNGLASVFVGGAEDLIQVFSEQFLFVTG
jgi:hypothetical protein